MHGLSPTPFLAVDNKQVEDVLVGSLSSSCKPLSRTIRLYVSSEWEGIYIYRPLLKYYKWVCMHACHCKKERVVLTNFVYLSCTQYCCKPLTKEWHLHTNLTMHALI